MAGYRAPRYYRFPCYLAELEFCRESGTSHATKIETAKLSAPTCRLKGEILKLNGGVVVVEEDFHGQSSRPTIATCTANGIRSSYIMSEPLWSEGASQAHKNDGAGSAVASERLDELSGRTVESVTREVLILFLEIIADPARSHDSEDGTEILSL
jgi:hypothetical protein